MGILLEADCWNATRVLLGVAIFFQSLEELQLERGPQSALLVSESEAGAFFGFPMPSLRFLCWARFGALALILLRPESWPIWALLLGFSWLRSLRFLGSLNGGSDALTHVSLMGVVMALSLGSPKSGLYWIGVQVILSYFLSGLRKAKGREWWNGQALKAFLGQSPVRVSKGVRVLLNNSQALWMGSIAVLLFELAFPLAALSRSISLIFLACGGAFHFAVFLCFGLNRFFWVWLAGYPAVYFIASSFSR